MVGPPMCQVLLAALALSAGMAVPVSRLVDLMWGAHRPRTAERTLHSYVTRLRQALGAGAIATVGAAYRLDLPADAVDALRFQRHADAGDAAAALAEWTGPPLAGLHVTPGLAAVLDGLEERWLAAVEQELADRVETDPVASVGRLTELTAGHPTREGLWALLMTALYRAGRQTDALAAYQTARRHLVEHLGVEPGPRLRELEAMVLGQDDRLAASGSPGGPRPAAEDGRAGNLPLRLGRLIGRDQELGAVSLALSVWPVVTLIGPGGIGKTRLAVAAASREGDEDGVWLVDLVEVGSSADVPRVVAGTLGVKEKAGRELTEAIVSALRPRRALVVLDNCEHVLDGAAALAQAIADGCPGTRVLATSRERLGLRDGHEKIVPVGPLEPDGPGVELFRERAAALSPGFGPEAEDGVVTAICRRLEGVPLAIELAAARTATLTPTELLTRLDDQLRLLVAVGGGGRASARRHRAMRATVQWSYDLLAPAERLLLRRLAIFVGAFDLAAAAAVAAGPGTTDPATSDSATSAPAPAEELLAGLVARSMVVAEPGVASRRFRFLEPIRQFAAEKLAEAGETDLMAARHAAWCTERVGGIHRLLTGRGEAAGTAQLDDLWPNLRAAFDWASGRADRHLAHALVRPLVTEIPRRNRAELGDWVERLLAMAAPGEADLVAFGLTWAGQRHKLAQDPAAFERLVTRHGPAGTGAASGGGSAIALATAWALVPDVDKAVVDGFLDVAVRHAQASVHQDFPALGELAPLMISRLRARGEDDLAEHFELDVGASMIFGGRFEDGDAFVDALAGRYRADGPPTLLNMALVLLGYSALLQGRQERAEALLAAAIAVEVPERTHSPNRCVEARAYFRRGETARAFAILRAHIDELLDTGNMQGICVTAVEFVNMMVQADRLADADRVLRHLDRTAPYWAGLVADARHAIGTTPRLTAPEPHLPTPDLDDHQTLEYMRSVLAELIPAARG
ncbi:BTAD domain-containing putative transcriptional regulator [Pseudofrankia saprophytica]|uniref:BTAD domain-containing putative transcriptional regulator n=1 Tax=Pseudofrankia saprophytica TaxID=298655 RepID=UPI0003092CA0|nr:BTAD domain-containing putative transcriptional regulator [Pseudofrankia saprophytica]